MITLPEQKKLTVDIKDLQQGELFTAECGWGDVYMVIYLSDWDGEKLRKSPDYVVVNSANPAMIGCRLTFDELAQGMGTRATPLELETPAVARYNLDFEG